MYISPVDYIAHADFEAYKVHVVRILSHKYDDYQNVVNKFNDFVNDIPLPLTNNQKYILLHICGVDRFSSFIYVIFNLYCRENDINEDDLEESTENDIRQKIRDFFDDIEPDVQTDYCATVLEEIVAFESHNYDGINDPNHPADNYDELIALPI